MDRHRFLRVSMAAVLTASLMATPAMATTSGSFTKKVFLVFLPGINTDGTLNYPGPDGGPDDDSDPYTNDGQFVVDTVCVNTTNGRFLFSVCGRVDNDSGQCQHYSNENFFYIDLTDSTLGPDPADISIFLSCYSVSRPCHCKSFVRYFGAATDEDFAP